MGKQQLDSGRIAMEWKVLQQYLPPHSFQFCDLGSDVPYVTIKATTNSGKIYPLIIELKGFPTETPDAYVDKVLLTKDGEPMTSSKMLAINGKNNRTYILHHRPEQWWREMSLYKVYQKCLQWLEAYEQHLQTGKDIRDILPEAESYDI